MLLGCAVVADHSGSVASGNTSSTSTGSSITSGDCHTADVLIVPSGIGITLSPSSIVLGLGLPKPCLSQRCDA